MTTILIIDDNPLHKKIMGDFLQAAGYHMLDADDAETGLDMAASERPDLILMDLQLPNMDGLTATRILKNDTRLRHIPVIALTAQAMQGDRERALRAGCDAYISKPFDLYEFTACVRDLLKTV